MKDDKLYFIHIIECIEKIEKYTKGVKEIDFLDNSMLQDAVMRNLQIMAESTQRISEIQKDETPNIPWHKLSGFRNVIVHSYMGLDIERIWKTIKEDIPSLKIAIKELLDK